MKPLHRKVIELQSRLGYKLINDMVIPQSGIVEFYKHKHGDKFDVVKIKNIGSGIKSATMAKIIRRVIRECKWSTHQRQVAKHKFWLRYRLTVQLQLIFAEELVGEVDTVSPH